LKSFAWIGVDRDRRRRADAHERQVALVDVRFDPHPRQIGDRVIPREKLHEVNLSELDRILDKISASGIGSLTPGEREFLDRFSTRH
jgi:hypothetical protein